ncbi:MAG: carboxymethylenebutenolidase [Mycobacterium sp.]|nr:carboxymethylenebutenolidase [Mycobacterium sp.]
MPDDFLAVPAGAGPWPGVVVIHDAGGLSEDIRRACRRLADAGFVALAPNLYHPGERVRCVVGMVRALKSGAGRAVDDIVAARDRLTDDPRCTGRVGAVGFCTGGGFCLMLAPTGTFDAVAPSYGNWPPDSDSLRHSCPTVASYGARDRALRGDAARLEAILTEGGVPHDVKEYPGVGHSFMNDWRDAPLRLRVFESFTDFAFSESEADDAWRRIIKFFGHHLGLP